MSQPGLPSSRTLNGLNQAHNGLWLLASFRRAHHYSHTNIDSSLIIRMSSIHAGVSKGVKGTSGSRKSSRWGGWWPSSAVCTAGASPLTASTQNPVTEARTRPRFGQSSPSEFGMSQMMSDIMQGLERLEQETQFKEAENETLKLAIKSLVNDSKDKNRSLKTLGKYGVVIDISGRARVEGSSSLSGSSESFGHSSEEDSIKAYSPGPDDFTDPGEDCNMIADENQGDLLLHGSFQTDRDAKIILPPGGLSEGTSSETIDPVSGSFAVKTFPLLDAPTTYSFPQRCHTSPAMHDRYSHYGVSTPGNSQHASYRAMK